MMKIDYFEKIQIVALLSRRRSSRCYETHQTGVLILECSGSIYYFKFARELGDDGKVAFLFTSNFFFRADLFYNIYCVTWLSDDLHGRRVAKCWTIKAGYSGLIKVSCIIAKMSCSYLTKI